MSNKLSKLMGLVDARGSRAVFSRGKPVYRGTSNSPHPGRPKVPANRQRMVASKLQNSRSPERQNENEAFPHRNTSGNLTSSRPRPVAEKGQGRISKPTGVPTGKGTLGSRRGRDLDMEEGKMYAGGSRRFNEGLPNIPEKAAMRRRQKMVRNAALKRMNRRGK